MLLHDADCVMNLNESLSVSLSLSLIHSLSVCVCVSVLAAFALSQVSEEDLIQNPQFCKLLATLSQHVDRTGLTQHLRRDREISFLI